MPLSFSVTLSIFLFAMIAMGKAGELFNIGFISPMKRQLFSICNRMI